MTGQRYEKSGNSGCCGRFREAGKCSRPPECRRPTAGLACSPIRNGIAARRASPAGARAPRGVFSGDLQLAEYDPSVAARDADEGAPVALDRAAGRPVCSLFERRRKDLGRLHLVRPVAEHPRPGRRIGRQTADEVDDPAAFAVPVDPAVLLEDLGGRMQRRLVGVFLHYGGDVSRRNAVYRLQYEPGAYRHQLFVECSHVVLVENRHLDLPQNGPFVDLVVQQEGCHSGLPLAVDDGPVDRGRAAVLRQQRGVEVERPQPRHGPDDLGQHAEGDDDPQIGAQLAHRIDELSGLQLLGLEDRQSQFAGGCLHVAFVHLLPAAGGFVGCGHHRHDAVSSGNERAERRHGELGRAHEYDTELFRIHPSIFSPGPACGACAPAWSPDSVRCTCSGR